MLNKTAKRAGAGRLGGLPAMVGAKNCNCAYGRGTALHYL